MKKNATDHTLQLIIVAILSWVIPGGGHFFIRQRKRGIVIFLTISFTFLAGLYIGSIGVIQAKPMNFWYAGQVLVSPVVMIIGSITAASPEQYIVYGKPHEIAQIYTLTAGLMNLLAILSAVYMAYTGRGEMIGTEEENEPPAPTGENQ